MAEWVCPIHEDVVLYDDDSRTNMNDIKMQQVRIEPPKYCEKCDLFRYKNECKKKGAK